MLSEATDILDIFRHSGHREITDDGFRLRQVVAGDRVVRLGQCSEGVVRDYGLFTRIRGDLRFIRTSHCIGEALEWLNEGVI